MCTELTSLICLLLRLVYHVLNKDRFGSASLQTSIPGGPGPFRLFTSNTARNCGPTFVTLWTCRQHLTSSLWPLSVYWSYLIQKCHYIIHPPIDADIFLDSFLVKNFPGTVWRHAFHFPYTCVKLANICLSWMSPVLGLFWYPEVVCLCLSISRICFTRTFSLLSHLPNGMPCLIRTRFILFQKS